MNIVDMPVFASFFGMLIIDLLCLVSGEYGWFIGITIFLLWAFNESYHIYEHKWLKNIHKHGGKMENES